MSAKRVKKKSSCHCGKGEANALGLAGEEGRWCLGGSHSGADGGKARSVHYHHKWPIVKGRGRDKGDEVFFHQTALPTFLWVESGIRLVGEKRKGEATVVNGLGKIVLGNPREGAFV